MIEDMFDDKRQGGEGEEHLPSYNETMASSNGSGGTSPPRYRPSEVAELFEGLNFQQFDSVPDKERVICHLKLMRLFHNLREEIEDMDGLFDLWDEDTELNHAENNSVHLKHGKVVLEGSQEVSKENSCKGQRPRMTVREKRWEAYVYAAVDRFEEWWEKMFVRGSVRSGVESITEELKYIPGVTKGFLSLTYLPPLDVLMVWHAFMMNPRAYAEECFKNRVRNNIWNEDFPWRMVDMVIDSSFNYNATNMDKRRFTEITALSWDLLDGTKFKVVECFHCSKPVNIPLVYVDREGLYRPEKSYISPDYHGTCGSCQGFIDHDGLRVLKVRKEYEYNIGLFCAMPGLILDPLNGKLDKFKPFETSIHRTFSSYETVKEFLPLLYPGENNPSPSMEDVKWAFQDKAILPKNSNPHIEELRLQEFLHSCSRASSSFSISLEEAIFRQDLFVNRICQLDWIHSPSLQSAAARMIARYQNFLGMLKATSLNMTMLPAIDINLVMWTHQLFPLKYYTTVTKLTNCFLDYNHITISDELFSSTSQTYESMYAQVYLECMCWYCMATRKVSIPRNRPKKKGKANVPAPTTCGNLPQQNCPWFGSDTRTVRFTQTLFTNT